MKRVIGFWCVLLLAMVPGFAQDVSDAASDAAPAETSDAQAETPAETAPEEVATDGEAPASPEKDGRFVVICPINEEIDEGIAVVVKRAAESAKDAEALLFVVNTPGGRVDSAIEITTAIMSVECPTIAYVEGMGAISAGALISYSCDAIYMAKGSNIGASTPIMPGAETTPDMDEKSNSFVRGKYRALGEANGHDPLLGEAMVDREMELRAFQNEDGTYTIFEVDPEKRERSSGGREGDFLDRILDEVSNGEEPEDIGDLLRKVVGAGSDSPRSLPAASRDQEDEYRDFLNENTELVSARGELLTLTSEEAVHFGLAKGITTDVDDTLREYLLGSVDRLTITPTWEEALFAFLTSPTIAGLLLMAGLGGIYVEVRTPGFGAPGIIGATCLALFFGSHMVLGMAEWIDIVLIMCGFALIVAEVFLLPGFGIAGILGFTCLIAGAYMAMVKAPIPDPSFYWEMIDMHEALYSLTVTFISFLIFVFASGFILPYTPMGKALILNDSQATDAGFIAQTAEEVQEALGQVGTAATALRPSGRGRFGTKKFDVVTRGEFIDAGTPIRIIESSGNRHVVTAVKPEENA